MNTLEIWNLKKHYRGRVVVRDISFYLKSSEVVGLLGPNGAGKTTSFYMVLGLVTVDGGKILLNHHNITNFTIDERARLGIGYLPQEPSIFRKLSVLENLMAVLELRRDLTFEQCQNLSEGLLMEFNIYHLRDNLGISLSGGERRRVEIARTLALEPKFILLDEPFAGIDPISVIDLKQIIHKLKERGVGVLITDHNVRETLAICDRAYIVNSGAVIAQGSPQDILQNQEARAVYLGDNFNL